MYALTGILAALVQKGRTGEGANVKVAMLDALAEWMTYPMYSHACAGPQLVVRDRWRDVVTPNGIVRALLPPFAFSDHEAAIGSVPALGEHTDAILRELGYADTAIAAMHATGAA